VTADTTAIDLHVGNGPNARPLTPWLWLLDLPAGGSALDASGRPSDVAEQLSFHFSDVAVLEGPIVPDALPWAQATFDCIAVHDRFAACDLNEPQNLDLLVELRALLKPGGWLVGASPNPAHVRAGSDGKLGIPSRVFSRALLSAGFREVRCVFVHPSLENPTTLVPDTPETVRAYEESRVVHDHARWPRRIAARVGLHRWLYEAYFLLARA
jgi:SAM-dependent methyltransferase